MAWYGNIIAEGSMPGIGGRIIASEDTGNIPGCGKYKPAPGGGAVWGGTCCGVIFGGSTHLSNSIHSENIMHT